MNTDSKKLPWPTTRVLVVFFALTFALTWGLAAGRTPAAGWLNEASCREHPIPMKGNLPLLPADTTAQHDRQP